MSRPIIIPGNHVYFARAGATIDAETVSATSKPDTDPEANWTNLGEVESADINLTEEEVEHWKSAPGKKRLNDVLLGKVDLQIDVVISELSAFAFEQIFGTALINVAGGGAFVPTGRTAFTKGWFKFQQYDSLDQNLTIMDIWARAKLSGNVSFGDPDTIVNLPLNIRMLYSTLSSGSLANVPDAS